MFLIRPLCMGKCIKFRILYRYFYKINDNMKSDLVPGVPISQVQEILRQRHITGIEGHACIAINCPICDTEKSKKAKIYINKTTGYFICDKCSSKGTWDLLEKLLLTKSTKSSSVQKELETVRNIIKTQEDYTSKWNDIIKSNCLIANLSPYLYEEILSKFSLPKISQRDISQLNGVYSTTHALLYFPLIAFGSNIVGYKTLSSESGLEQTLPTSNIGGCIIYKQKNTRDNGTAVVVPTIHDLLALASQKAAGRIICLPYNLQNLPQQLLPSLEDFKKLILWFGNDEPSWYTARQFAKKLNEKRCSFVRPIGTQPRPKVATDKGYNLKDILTNAFPIWHKSITTFDDLRQDILCDLQNIDKVQGVKWKRYPTLNRILGGHRRGEVTILTGPTGVIFSGSGKTTFMSEYSLDLAMQGVNTLWGSFEIRNARLAKTMLQQMAGVSLEDNLDEFNTYADAFSKLPIYFMAFHGQQNINVVMDAIQHATYVYDIAHVIIDNMQFMIGVSDDSKINRYWKQDKVIEEFRNFATKYNCHVSMVIHPRKEKDDELTTLSIFGSAKASQEADNVLIIQDKRVTNIRGKKYLQVTKNRYSGDLGVMVMDFDKQKLSYAEKKKVKSEEKEEEKVHSL
ncbi:twinkle protein, mitochondrial isoform X2 [Odontomachus brunneus]|uniref:twinkle protein, mitochondrial isoform X2 n=1 Tax=Odontomachus brunneus TaxID=486640 RepID=UPI0013F264F7|nr:twinkle protein, mitochondrial isoform X2 [Odontomachus brunneus]